MKSFRPFIIAAIAITLTTSTLLPFNARAQKAAHRSPQSKPTPSTFDDPALVKKYQAGITAASLSPPLYYLASDVLEGRETGARGQHLAAEYLAKQYRTMGLSPKGTGQATGADSPEPYFQHFQLYPLTPNETKLELSVRGKPVVTSTFSAAAHDDLSSFASGNAKNGRGGLVFGGYGIADRALGYDDYASLAAKGISIDGKWLVLLRDEPMSNATTSLLPTAEHKLSRWSGGLTKANAWVKAGRPLGILIVSDIGPRNQLAFADASALASAGAQRIGPLTPNQGSYVPQIYNISAKFADQILAGSGQTVAAIKQNIDQTLAPNVFELKDATITARVQLRPGLDTENVLAFIEGSDAKLKNEVLVLSAHHDHLGVNPLLKGDQIFNGAADDGSGVVACLELARAFMAAKRDGFGPRRSILFLNPTGEEKGILGSANYLGGTPTVTLDHIAADINMDGVAGVDLNHPTKSTNYIYIGGAKGLSDDLVAINRRVKEAVGSTIELTDDNFPSDSVSFEAQMIPYIYFSTGLTEHYHQVSDEASTIDFEHFARVTQLIFATAWQIANQEARIAGVDRNKMTAVGYACRPCGSECDNTVYHAPGTCPVCGMTLMRKWETKK
ncbi:MAG: M28 family peptidase [Pyrinomonadaceae bacterium]